MLQSQKYMIDHAADLAMSNKDQKETVVQSAAASFSEKDPLD